MAALELLLQLPLLVFRQRRRQREAIGHVEVVLVPEPVELGFQLLDTEKDIHQGEIPGFFERLLVVTDTLGSGIDISDFGKRDTLQMTLAQEPLNSAPRASKLFSGLVNGLQLYVASHSQLPSVMLKVT